jgi:hypothetical protein
MRLLAGVGLCIEMLEYVSHPDLFSADGLLSWEVLKLRTRLTTSGFIARLGDVIFDLRAIRILALVGVITSIGLVIIPKEGWIIRLDVGLLLSCLITLNLRSFYSLDGADQMYLVIVGAIFVGFFATPVSLGSEITLWFVALQATLCYSVSGVYKAMSPGWRTGEALEGIFSTRIYGNAIVFQVFRRWPWLKLPVAWFIIIFQCCFLLALLGGPSVARVLIAIGVLFHILNAVTMGLNGFLFAFVATYPAVMYCSSVWRAAG